RAIEAATGLEVQFAVPPDAPAVRTEAQPRPPSVDVLPSKVELSRVEALSTCDTDEWSLGIALADADLAPCALHLCGGDAALIAGPPRSGKSTVLANVVTVLRRHAPAVHVVAVTPRRSPLRACPVDRLIEDVDDLAEAIEE